MTHPITLNADHTLVLPSDLLKGYKTSRFAVTLLEGALLIEPEEDESRPFALTSDEEEKLRHALAEPSLPLSLLEQ